MGMKHSVCEPTTPDRPIPTYVPSAPRKHYKSPTPLFSPPRVRLFGWDSRPKQKVQKCFTSRSVGTQTDADSTFDPAAPYQLITESMMGRCQVCSCQTTFVMDDLHDLGCFGCGSYGKMDRAIMVSPYYLLDNKKEI
jgi:hypothetical protein